MELTEPRRDALERLYGYRGHWIRPMDIGGRDGSDLSARLTWLVKNGFAESKQRRIDGVSYRRGSKQYRITAAGIAWYEAKHGVPAPARPWMRMAAAEAQAVPCPRCDAAVGEPCTTGKPHLMRQKTAAETAK